MNESSGRQNIRVPMQLNIDLFFPEHTYRNCITRDLCLKGLWVFGCQGQMSGDLCDIEISEKEVPINRTIRMRGEVVRTNDDGIAIIFVDMNIRSYTDLQTLLIYRSEDPFRIAEEFLDEFVPVKKA